MELSNNFNPDRVIRNKEIVTPNGTITAILYENEISKYYIVFLDKMEILKEVDVTDEVLDFGSFIAIDALIYDLASEITRSKPW